MQRASIMESFKEEIMQVVEKYEEGCLMAVEAVKMVYMAAHLTLEKLDKVEI